MKKVIIILIIVILLIGGIGAGFYFYKKNKDKPAKSYFHEVTYKELKKMVDDKKDFILVIHQTGCSHCANYLPIVESISNEYKIDVYNINTSLFDEDESYKFTGLIKYPGTPTTIFFFNGEEKTTLNRINGETNRTATIERYKSLGFISD